MPLKYIKNFFFERASSFDKSSKRYYVTMNEISNMPDNDFYCVSNLFNDIIFKHISGQGQGRRTFHKRVFS